MAVGHFEAGAAAEFVEEVQQERMSGRPTGRVARHQPTPAIIAMIANTAITGPSRDHEGAGAAGDVGINSARLISLADCHRPSGYFSGHAASTLSSAGGVTGTRSCAARLPVKISHRTQPNE